MRSSVKPVLLDGATGSELSRRGLSLPPPLWSAQALLDCPEMLEAIHREYLEAGADIITANTFRTHRRTLAQAGFGDRATELTGRAVDIAMRARASINSRARVFGSVAPLEDCYQPERAPASDECAHEHRAMIDDLLEAGVDGLLLETQNNRREALVAAGQATEASAHRGSNVPWIISFCTRSEGPPNILLSGESLVDLLPSLESAYAIGVNCLAAPAMEAQVKMLRTLVPPAVHLVAYANTGWLGTDGAWTATDASAPEKYADYAMRWIEAGASVIGGCCGTTPETIAAISRRLKSRLPEHAF